ncbi:hypothetical protein ACLK17_17270 [Escherichia coli]
MFVIMVTPLPSSWPAMNSRQKKAGAIGCSIEWQELPVITTPRKAALAEDAAPIHNGGNLLNKARCRR